MRAVVDLGRPEPAPRALTLSVRAVGAGLLLAAGGIHLHLWLVGYRYIAWIGPLFLANAVLAALAALAVVAAPPRWLPYAGLLGALLQSGTLGGLLLSLTVGLFGFVESWQARFVVPTIVVEAAGSVVLAGYGALELRRRSRQRARGARSWWA